MQVARAVHGREPVEQRGHQGDDRLLGELLVAPAPRLERLAALVLEHHVRRAIRLEEAHHADDVGVAEGGEGARLHEEAVQPREVEVLVLVGARRDGVVGRAVGELLGQVLLDHHLRVEVGVGGRVDDPEAALAEHRVEAVFHQAIAVRQRHARARASARKRPTWFVRCERPRHIHLIQRGRLEVLPHALPRYPGAPTPARPNATTWRQKPRKVTEGQSLTTVILTIALGS